ncbi:MAG: HesB/IscA family protein [Pirellulales bacterium]
MAVTLTEKAVAEVKRTMETSQAPEGTVLRVGVRGGGCAGYDYVFGFDTSFDEKADSKYDYDGLTLVVDKKSSLLLDGTTIDYYDGLEKRGFQFLNPNAVKTCGCGSSFQA